MNIFYLDPNPKVAAELMTDKHVVKMILESAQMLSTAHRTLNPEGSHPMLYRIAYQNHPSTVWVRTSRAHYLWLYRHFIALCDEYSKRYFGRIHSTDKKLRTLLSFIPANIPDTKFVTPPLCMPDEYKRGSALDSYRLYYLSEKISDREYQQRFKTYFRINNELF